MNYFPFFPPVFLEKCLNLFNSIYKYHYFYKQIDLSSAKFHRTLKQDNRNISNNVDGFDVNQTARKVLSKSFRFDQSFLDFLTRSVFRAIFPIEPYRTYNL